MEEENVPLFGGGGHGDCYRPVRTRQRKRLRSLNRQRRTNAHGTGATSAAKCKQRLITLDDEIKGPWAFVVDEQKGSVEPVIPPRVLKHSDWWWCVICTYVNHPTDHRCRACETMPSGATAFHPLALIRKIRSEDRRSRTPYKTAAQQPHWTCTVCFRHHVVRSGQPVYTTCTFCSSPATVSHIEPPEPTQELLDMSATDLSGLSHRSFTATQAMNVDYLGDEEAGGQEDLGDPYAWSEFDELPTAEDEAVERAEDRPKKRHGIALPPTVVDVW